MPVTKTEIQKPLWTPARLAFTVVVLGLFAAFGISSCNSNDEMRPAAANPPKTTVPPTRNAPAPADCRVDHLAT